MRDQAGKKPVKVGYRFEIEVPVDTDLKRLLVQLQQGISEKANLKQEWVLVSEEERLTELARTDEKVR